MSGAFQVGWDRTQERQFVRRQSPTIRMRDQIYVDYRVVLEAEQRRRPIAVVLVAER